MYHLKLYLSGMSKFNCSDSGEKLVDKIPPLIQKTEHLFHCDQCEKQFKTKNTLRIHSRTHLNESSLICDNCGYKFSNKYRLQAHKSKSSCKRKKTEVCPLCQKDGTKQELLHHFETFHNIKIQIENLIFSRRADYEAWKDELENKTRSRFCVASSDERRGYATLYCHRSGHYTPKDKRLRHLKTLGSNKIGGFCPAKISIKPDVDGQTHVKFVKTHVGHDFELERLTLTKTERMSVASMLSSKIPFDAILDDVRSSVNEEHQRLDLLKRKDLFNIEKEFHLNSVRHADGTLSVDNWVNEMNNAGETLIRFYKSKGRSDSNSFLDDEDFVLILMSDAQKDWLQSFGDVIICVDKLHGMYGNNFEITTLLVLNESLQVLPCAFMWSNRIDVKVMALFFRTIMKGLSIQPKSFMSNVEKVYYSSWGEVMPPVEKQLYCSWHVDHVWRSNLIKIKDKTKRAEVYKTLRSLLTESDPYAFLNMLSDFQSNLENNPDTKNFWIYLKNNYLGEVLTKRWAYCYRHDSEINADINLKRMHQTLKRKINKRLINVIQGIIEFIKGIIHEKQPTTSKVEVHLVRTIPSQTIVVEEQQGSSEETGIQNRSLLNNESNENGGEASILIDDLTCEEPQLPTSEHSLDREKESLMGEVSDVIKSLSSKEEIDLAKEVFQRLKSQLQFLR